MWLALCFALVGSALLLRATPRMEGPLRSCLPLGLAATALAVWRLHASGWGWGVAVAVVLAMVMLALPGLSYCVAIRRERRKAPQ